MLKSYIHLFIYSNFIGEKKDPKNIKTILLQS